MLKIEIFHVIDMFQTIFLVNNNHHHNKKFTATKPLSVCTFILQ